MKVKLENILPNPYRDLKKYPLEEEKVKRLVSYFESSGWWEGLVGRPHPTIPGKFQSAFGEHRKEALRQSEITEVELIVKDISDDVMYKMFKDENAEFNYIRTVGYINETVEASKNRIEKEINSKNCVWNDLEQWCKDCFENEDGYNRAVLGQNKADRSDVLIGREPILKDLGPSWSNRQVRIALQYIKGSSDRLEKDAEGVLQHISVPISKVTTEKFELQDHSDAAVRVFKSPEGRVAFNSMEAQEEAVESLQRDFLEETVNPNTPTPKISGSLIEKRLLDKAKTYIEANSIPLDTESKKEKAVPAEMIKNRRYFNKARISFNTYTIKPNDIPCYPKHIAEVDYHLLGNLHKTIIRRMREYEVLFGFKATIPKHVYEFYDATDDEESRLMGSWKEYEKEDELTMDIESWCSEDGDILDSIKNTRDIPNYDTLKGESEEYWRDKIKERKNES